MGQNKCSRLPSLSAGGGLHTQWPLEEGKEEDEALSPLCSLS